MALIPAIVRVMKNFLFSFLALSLFSAPSQAAIFDAADILPMNSGAVGVFGELLLSDPTSEGLEARGRYGLSDSWNLGTSIGYGSRSKRFRVGFESVYNILPDYESQIGFSALASAAYINRNSSGGILFRIAPIVHKEFPSWAGTPANIYLSLPLSVEARSGRYETASQLVLGSVIDMNDQRRYYFVGEAGIRLSKAESYVLFGAGVRLGDLRFERKASAKSDSPTGAPAGDEYREEDFE